MSTHPHEPPTDDTWSLREQILAGLNFVPLLQENFAAKNVTDHYPATPTQVDSLLGQFVAEGLLTSRVIHGGMVIFSPTPESWRARERLLLDRGLRHPALVHQLDHSLEDLVIAIAMAPTIHNSKLEGTFGEAESVATEELETYLSAFPPETIQVLIATLPNQPNGFFSSASRLFHGSTTHPAIALTKLGKQHYASEVSNRLGIAAGMSILEFDVRTHLEVFWAWQSEFRDSRSLFKDALKESIRRINRDRKPIPPLRLVEASEPGEGAIRIDVEIQNKIRRAEFFVGDLTAVHQYDGRMRINENVLVEVGYALASKTPDQIVLLALTRDFIPGPNTGPASRAFDIAHVHRLEFKADAKPSDIRSRIQLELEAAMQRRGTLRDSAPGRSGRKP